MKFEWNKKYLTVSTYAFLTAAAVIALIFCIIFFPEIKSGFFYVADVLEPITYGLVFAYLLNPIEKKFNQMFKRMFSKSNRVTKLPL